MERYIVPTGFKMPITVPFSLSTIDPPQNVAHFSRHPASTTKNRSIHSVRKAIRFPVRLDKSSSVAQAFAARPYKILSTSMNYRISAVDQISRSKSEGRASTSGHTLADDVLKINAFVDRSRGCRGRPVLVVSSRAALLAFIEPAHANIVYAGPVRHEVVAVLSRLALLPPYFFHGESAVISRENGAERLEGWSRAIGIGCSRAFVELGNV